MLRGPKQIILSLITLSSILIIIPDNPNMSLASTGLSNIKSSKNTYSPSITDTIVQVTSNTGSDYEPFIFRDNLNRFWILWANGSGANGVIWARYYNESDNVLGTPFRITDNPSDDWNPTGFLDHRGVLWIFWQSNRNGNYDIWYKNSSNNGGLWSTAYQLTNSTSNEGKPYCAMDEFNEFWVFFEISNGGNNDIVYSTSSNNGSTWTPIQSISISSDLIHEEIQDVYINDNNEIFILVQELSGSFASYLWTTPDSGANWVKNEISSFDNTGWGTIFGENNNLYIIVKRGNDLFFLNSTDPVNEWSEENPIILSNRYAQQPNGDIYTNSSLYAVYISNQTGNWEVFLEITPPEILSENESQPDILGYLLPGLLLLILVSSVIITVPFIWGKKDGDREIHSDKTFNYQLSTVFYTLIGNLAIKPTIRRLSIDEVEENDIRHQILELLHQYEFLHFRDLKRITKKGTSHLRWHLRILAEFGHIKYSQTGQYLIYYLRSKEPPQEYLHVYFNLLSKPSLKVASAFTKMDIWRIPDLKKYLELPEKTVRYHCKKLEKVKILQKSGKALFKLNDYYGEWIQKVMVKRKNS